MKKVQLLVFTLLSFLFGGILFAQQSNVSTPLPEVSDLGDVKIRFCNDPTEQGGTRTLTLQTKTSVDNEICVIIQNTGPTPLKIGINFVDGWYTQGSDVPKKACQTEEMKERFGQFVTAPSTWFSLEPDQAISTKVKLRFPEGYAGVVNGCITSHIIEEKKNQWMITVLSRRANFIDVYVDGLIKLWMSYGSFSGGSIFKNISNTDLLTLYERQDDFKYAVRYMLVNTGNVPVITTGNAKLQLFWFFEKKWNNIQSKINSSGFTYVDIEMPFYFKYIGGPIKFNLDNSYRADVPAEMPNYEKIVAPEYTISLTANAFLMPWWLVIILALIILIIIIRKIRKSNKSIKPKHDNQKE